MTFALGQLWRSRVTEVLFRVVSIDLHNPVADERVKLEIVELGKLSNQCGYGIGDTVTTEPAWFDHGDARLESEAV